MAEKSRDTFPIYVSKEALRLFRAIQADAQLDSELRLSSDDILMSLMEVAAKRKSDK